MAFAATLGGALPLEIVRMIVVSLTAHTQHDQEYKRGLAACSLTCHYWARILRPALFNRLTLRTSQEVSDLLSFLTLSNNLSPALHDCIERIEYWITDNQLPPWLRLYRLSKVIPHVYMELVIGDILAPRNSVIPGASLLKNFPRTLPPSLFPFGAVYVCCIDFSNASEFTSLFHNTAKLGYGALYDVFIMQKPPLRAKRALRWKRRVELDVSAVELGSDTLSSQFRLASAILLLDSRLCLDAVTWATAVNIIERLIPARYRLGQIEVDRGARGRRASVLSLTAHSNFDFEDEWTELRLVFEWRPLGVDMHCESVDVSMYGEGPLFGQDDWDSFERQFLREVHRGFLYVAVDKEAVTLDAILQDKILKRISEAGRLRLGRLRPDGNTGDCWVTKEEISDTPLMDTTSFRTSIPLTTYSRLRWAMNDFAGRRDLRRMKAFMEGDPNLNIDEETYPTPSNSEVDSDEEIPVPYSDSDSEPDEAVYVLDPGSASNLAEESSASDADDSRSMSEVLDYLESVLGVENQLPQS